MGAVSDLILDADKLCRAAVVRTPTGHTIRSIIKLYSSEVHSDSIQISPLSGVSPDMPRRSFRKAASTAKDDITAQLIDASQD